MGGRVSVATALGLVTVLALAGCSAGRLGDPTPEPGPTTSTPSVPVVPERFTGQRFDWQPCGDRECASVEAPMDWEHPSDGRTVQLAALRVPADTQPAKGTIFVNPGGPGSSGKALADRFKRDGLTDYDIVGWDPRGVGDSSPIECAQGRELDPMFEADQSPDDAAERAEFEKIARDFAAGCEQRTEPGLLEHVSTVDTVRDLELLRQVVGDDRLNYLGYSYGTEIGAIYAVMFPEQVGRLVLDSPVDPWADPMTSVPQSVGFDRALTRFAEWCVRDRCELGSTPDEVTSAVTGLLNQLDEQPLRVGDRQVTQSLGFAAVALPLYYDEQEYPILRDALLQARQGSGTYLLRLADHFNERDEHGEYGNMMSSFQAIRCVSSPRETLEEAYESMTLQAQEAPLLGPFFGVDVLCAQWPVPAQPNPEPTEPAAEPIMVVGSRYDSATPFEWAEGLVERVEPSFLVTWEGGGHSTYGHRSQCVDDAVVRYFHDRLPPEPLTCTK